MTTFDADRFHRLRGAHPLGARLDYRPSVGSTMDVAREAGHAGAAHGFVALADEQTAGRGRFGRRWVAPFGANLTFTLLLRPELAVLERLSMVAALAVGEAVAPVLGTHPDFKWPNDVQVAGRKLAGILIEAEFMGERPAFALVGIGLNVNMQTEAEPEVAAIAVSLRDLTGETVDREELLAALVAAFERWLDATAEETLDAWRSHLVTLGREIEVSFNGQVERGVAESVTRSGALQLRRDDGSVVELPAGEVTTRVARG